MSSQYFSRLNYTLANEDTSFELALLPERVDHIFSVTGSGGRVLPLLAKNPKQVTCVDLAVEQLYLAEMRFQSVLQLQHSEFLRFWGYPTQFSPISAEDRRDIFQRLKLSANARVFLEKTFLELNWGSLLYRGRWEQTFKKLSRLNRLLTGKKGTRIFEAKSKQEQLEYWQSRFPMNAWKSVLFLSGNASVFNMLLYKGSFPKKNIPESMFHFYVNTFDHLFRNTLARENFFLQLSFFGKIIHPEGCPVECKADVFAKAKEALKNTQINYVHGDVIEQIKQCEEPIDFLSFSDVPSYFSGERERTFLSDIRDRLRPGAKVIIRNYLHVPEGTDYSGYRDITGDYEKEALAEKVGVYRMNLRERM